MDILRPQPLKLLPKVRESPPGDHQRRVIAASTAQNLRSTPAATRRKNVEVLAASQALRDTNFAAPSQDKGSPMQMNAIQLQKTKPSGLHIMSLRSNIGIDSMDSFQHFSVHFHRMLLVPKLEGLEKEIQMERRRKSVKLKSWYLQSNISKLWRSRRGNLKKTRGPCWWMCSD